MHDLIFLNQSLLHNYIFERISAVSFLFFIYEIMAACIDGFIYFITADFRTIQFQISFIEQLKTATDDEYSESKQT